MDDLNDSNPLLGDEDAANPLLDDDEEVDENGLEDSLDLSSLDLGIDLGNLDTGTYENSRELIDGNPMLDYDDDYYDEALPSVPSSVVDDSYDNSDGHGVSEDRYHKVPEFYVDVNGDSDSDLSDEDEVYKGRRDRSYATEDDSGHDDYRDYDSGHDEYSRDDVMEYDIDDNASSSLGDSDVENDSFDNFDSLESILEASDSVVEVSDRDVDDNDDSENVDSILDKAFDDNDSDDSFAGAYDLDYDDDFDEFGGFDIDAIISLAIDMGASDVHISPDDLVSFTVLSDIHKIQDFGVMPAAIVQRIFTEITSHVSQADFSADLELDTSYVVRTGKHKGRSLRLNVVKTFSHFAMTFRVITNNIPSPADLGITGSLLDWCSLPNGLVMMNGKTGSGKTTTLASLVRQIQLTRPCKIITIERPIEFIYGTDGKALITQREVGRDTRTFAGALTSAMRQAPDIIMLGEVRTKVEVNELLRAAETGHLAISTMHTNSAPTTVNRIRSLYEGDDQVRILGSLAEVTRGFANQVLLKTKDGSGRFAVREVLEVNEDISKMISVGDIDGIKNYQLDHGITMDHGLVDAVSKGLCHHSAARIESSNVPLFDKLIKELG